MVCSSTEQKMRIWPLVAESERMLAEGFWNRSRVLVNHSTELLAGHAVVAATCNVTGSATESRALS